MGTKEATVKADLCAPHPASTRTPLIGIASTEDSDPSNNAPRAVGAVAAGKGRAQFFHELREILRDERLRHAVRWQTGHEVVVINPKLFERLVLSPPRSPTAIKFASFQRRLHRWGFRRDRDLVLYGNLITYKSSDFQFDDDGREEKRAEESRELHCMAVADQVRSQRVPRHTTTTTSSSTNTSVAPTERQLQRNIIEDHRLSAELLRRGDSSSERANSLHEASQPKEESSVMQVLLRQQEASNLRLRGSSNSNTSAPMERQLLRNIIEDRRLIAQLLCRGDPSPSGRANSLHQASQPMEERSVLQLLLRRQETTSLRLSGRRQQLLDSTNNVSSLTGLGRQLSLIDNSSALSNLPLDPIMRSSDLTVVPDRRLFMRANGEKNVVSSDQLERLHLVSTPPRESNLVRSLNNSRLDSIVRRMHMLQEEAAEELRRMR